MHLRPLSVKPLATDERTSLYELLRGLTPEQWAAPSLCAGWTVRDVVAHHLSYDDLPIPTMIGRFGRNLFRFAQTNQLGLDDLAGATPDQLLELLRAHLSPSGLPRAFGSRIALLDCMVHQQDIRRPLGLEREIPVQRWIPAIEFALVAPPIHAFHRIRGLHLVSADTDWSFGRGPEVRGPREALLMAVTGRPVALDDLTGPGVDALRDRMRE